MSCSVPEDWRKHVGEVSDLRQLRIFRSLAQTGSFTETARLMSVTQSAVSHSLKSLETSLGVTLFDRQGKSPTLTSDGEMFLISVSEILREISRATQKLHHFRQGELNTLRIGCPDTIGEFVLPDVLKTIHQEFPDARLFLRIGETGEMFSHLSSGVIDIMLGIGEAEKPNPGYQEADLFQDELCLITSADHPWASSKSELLERDFEGERLLLFGKKSLTNVMVRDWISKNDLRCEQQVEVSSIGALKKLVGCGFGVGMVPLWVLDEVEKGSSLAPLPVPGSALKRRWCLYMRQTHQYSPLEKRFFSLLRKQTASLNVEPG
ncbi:MAG: LysR family transcriptional regulator [Verrucomicrobiota bacterium]